MTDELFVDIETRSRTDIKKTTAYRYAEDPDFAILMAAYAYNDDPVQVLIGDDVNMLLPEIMGAADLVRVAHNAPFERICFSRAGGLPVGEYLPPEDWHDTMAVAGEKGYPQGLGNLAKALGAADKDEAGTALINFWCKPDRNGNFRRPEDHPEKWAMFVEYCRQDVVTLRDVHRLLGDFPTETERAVYLADQHINDRGMALDMEMAELATEAAEDNRMEQELEVMALTGVANPGSGVQLLEWLRGPGKAPLPNLQAETVRRALTRKNLPEKTRRVLELRQELALVASKKYTAALGTACADGRLRGAFKFFGAHTGRWAGRGLQPHNLPREQLPTEADTEAAILDLKLGAGVDAYTLKALVRALFVGPFSVVDYAAIEARVIAWLAGEAWALEAFRQRRDIYMETAGRMGPQYTRSDGKVAVLALGYNGGVNSLRAMGATGTEQDLKAIVTTWRKANPAIVDLWREMEHAFHKGGAVGERLEVLTDGDSRLLRLPSGRAITYHQCRWKWEDNKWGGRSLVASFADPKKPGVRASTYGGRLTENATQAVARDILAEALVRLEQHGYRPVAHVHDEILVETTDVERVREIMITPPAWADGLPIDGEGFTTARYRKG